MSYSYRKKSTKKTKSSTTSHKPHKKRQGIPTICPKCGSNNLYADNTNGKKGLYCKACGKWIKWLSDIDYETASTYDFLAYTPAYNDIEKTKVNVQNAFSIILKIQNDLQNICDKSRDINGKQYIPVGDVIDLIYNIADSTNILPTKLFAKPKIDTTADIVFK